MYEIEQIWLKYETHGFLDRLESLEDVNRIALTFCADVARTYPFDHVEAQPESEPLGIQTLPTHPSSGFSRASRSFSNLSASSMSWAMATTYAAFSRPLIESAIVATYLLREGDEAVEDFRRCSYKDALQDTARP